MEHEQHDISIGSEQHQNLSLSMDSRSNHLRLQDLIKSGPKAAGPKAAGPMAAGPKAAGPTAQP